MTPITPEAMKGVRTPKSWATAPEMTGPHMKAMPAIVIGRASASAWRSGGASSVIQAIPAVQTVPKPRPKTKRAVSNGQKPGIACATSAPDISVAAARVSRRAP